MELQWVGMTSQIPLFFYNPLTFSYYQLPAFRLDQSILPITNLLNPHHFDGGLTYGLL